MFRSLKKGDIREMLSQPLHDRLAIRVHHHLGYLRAGKQGTQDVMEEWFTCQGTVVLTWDTLRVVAHGNEGDNSRHITSWGDLSVLADCIGWGGCLWWCDGQRGWWR